MKGIAALLAGGLAAVVLIGLIVFIGWFFRPGRVPPGRYRMATDPGSRYSFKYVMDRRTKRWVNREIELRVSVARPLPEPLTDDAHGDRISLQLLRSGSAQTGGLRSGLPVIEAGWRVWRGWDVLREDDLRGQSSYGVSVQWPVAGQGTRFDATEIFRLPPLGSLPPDAWSEWAEAADRRAGAFGWWEEARGAPPADAPKPEYPFQFRYRLVLFENPGVTP